MSDIKEGVSELADKLMAGIDVKKTGEVTIADGIYISNLPDGLTKETLEAVVSYNTEFIAASAKVFGEKAITAMKANKDLDDVRTSIPTIGRDSINLGYKRSYDATPPGADEKVTRFGQLQASYKMHAASPQRGQLSKVREALSEQATKAFGD